LTSKSLPEEFVEGSSSPNTHHNTLNVLESSNNSYLDDMSSISNEDSHLDDMQSLHSLPDDTNSRSPTHNSGCGSGMKATLANLPRQTSSKTISMFSYGSGLISSIYAINLYSKPLYKFENTCSSTGSSNYHSAQPNSMPSPPKQQKQSINIPDYNHLFRLSNLVHNCQNLVKMLDSRKKISPEEFIEILKTKTQRPGLYVSPDEKVRKEDMFEDAFYLDEVDTMFRRSYKQNC
jgi:3-hydroxy-3-methylglutaryl CoA synthase